MPEFLGHPIGDHRGLLERRLVVLSPQQICGRLFEREAFVAHDLICDFCAATGIAWHPGLQHPPRLNETLSYPALRLLARVKERVPRWLDGPLNPPSRQEQERYAAYYRDAGDLRFTPDLSPLRPRWWICWCASARSCPPRPVAPDPDRGGPQATSSSRPSITSPLKKSARRLALSSSGERGAGGPAATAGAAAGGDAAGSGNGPGACAGWA